LKGVKSEVSIDFICLDNKKLLLTTNRVAISSNLNIIEKYLKDSNNIKHKGSMMLWDALDMNNFYFLFLLFSDFIGILFSFSFSFLLDNEDARDTAVT